MSLKCYRDPQANASVIESTADGTLGMYFNNELKAVGNGDGTCSIMNEPKSTDSTDFLKLRIWLLAILLMRTEIL